MTALNRNSKADTCLLTLAASGLSVDISQERDDLVDSTTYLREDASARTAITVPREVTVLFTAKTGDSGILVNHGTNDGASSTFRIDVTGGVLRCLENGSVRVSASLPSLAAGDRSFVAQWSTRLEGTDIRSELIVINQTVGTLAFGFATHAVGTTNTSWNLQIAGYGSGPTSAYDIADIRGVRIGKRAHSMTEAVEDWVTESTKPTLTATTRQAALPICAAIGAEGEFAGPAYRWAGATTRDSDRRLVSPLVNIRSPSEFSIALADHTDGSRRWYRPTPDDPDFYLSAQHFWHVPVPPGVSRAEVRIFVRSTSVGDDVCDLIFRAYSAANWPFVGESAQELTFFKTPDAVLNADHASGGGEWLSLGDMQIARDDLGMTSLMIAHSFDHGVPSDAASDTLFSILAVTIEPFSRPVNDDGFGYDSEP